MLGVSEFFTLIQFLVGRVEVDFRSEYVEPPNGQSRFFSIAGDDHRQ
jgi:hypothetical protein